MPHLRAEGLVTDREPIIAVAADGTVIEVFEWVSQEAISRLTRTPPGVPCGMNTSRFVPTCRSGNYPNRPNSSPSLGPCRRSPAGHDCRVLSPRGARLAAGSSQSGLALPVDAQLELGFSDHLS
ncbi:hypothetical protein, partial [Nitrobacter sp.]|uniref:hypothetical protein n=1 Tax=Nitrobacter sp. TaxID=29420 RepID=UPI0026279AFF